MPKLKVDIKRYLTQRNENICAHEAFEASIIDSIEQNPFLTPESLVLLNRIDNKDKKDKICLYQHEPFTFVYKRYMDGTETTLAEVRECLGYLDEAKKNIHNSVVTSQPGFKNFIPDITKDEYYARYRTIGYSKQVAYEKALKAAKNLYVRATSYQHAWWYDYIAIEIYKDNAILITDYPGLFLFNDDKVQDFYVNLGYTTQKLIAKINGKYDYLPSQTKH